MITKWIQSFQAVNTLGWHWTILKSWAHLSFFVYTVKWKPILLIIPTLKKIHLTYILHFVLNMLHITNIHPKHICKYFFQISPEFVLRLGPQTFCENSVHSSIIVFSPLNICMSPKRVSPAWSLSWLFWQPVASAIFLFFWAQTEEETGRPHHAGAKHQYQCWCKQLYPYLCFWCPQ